jgi:hypothetical protein
MMERQGKTMKFRYSSPTKLSSSDISSRSPCQFHCTEQPHLRYSSVKMNVPGGVRVDVHHGRPAKSFRLTDRTISSNDRLEESSIVSTGMN